MIFEIFDATNENFEPSTNSNNQGFLKKSRESLITSFFMSQSKQHISNCISDFDRQMRFQFWLFSLPDTKTESA